LVQQRKALEVRVRAADDSKIAQKFTAG